MTTITTTHTLAQLLALAQAARADLEAAHDAEEAANAADDPQARDAAWRACEAAAGRLAHAADEAARRRPGEFADVAALAGIALLTNSPGLGETTAERVAFAAIVSAAAL